MFGVIPLSVALITISSMVTGSPTPHVMSMHERCDAAPNNFVGVGMADLQASLNFCIGLMPKDTARLEKALYAVSKPDSDLYGQHLSFEEVKAFSTPTPEAATAVTAWLAENGITDVKLGGAFDDWLTFVAPVGKANTLLSAQYEDFVHIDTGELLIRTLTASIPSDLRDFIEVVHPMTSFGRLTFANPAPLSCNSVITPACLQALYGIPMTQATQSSNRLAVSGFINQFAQMADLQTFLTALRCDIPPMTMFAFQSVDGGLNTQGTNEAGIEANLDIQYTVGVATGVPTIFVSVGSSSTDSINDFFDIINALNAEASPPQVLTTSYSFDETDIPSSIATMYKHLCNAYMALSARGISILFASVSSSQAKTCMTFIPTFPVGCLFLTSVGATQGITEVAASLSSGGFSNLFAHPSYQVLAVSTYLAALGNTNARKFKTTGRGFPDVAAQGNNVEIMNGGRAGLVGGTSCSSSIFVSVISLINDCLISAGKKPLSFLNPFLYANPKAFFDITTSDNPGCGTSGFPARAGWDPVTSLGTPNFAALSKAAGI
ncbi:family S53 protease-like protein [Armillaria gallica]|uniref:Family S53 protease-like protein n=1 Tax=Armillaria gallica TaxID=47427 RepID=A0A2H3EBW8_ARMGA|nr:family S53 protease-like protein [Armillaria gallica]